MMDLNITYYKSFIYSGRFAKQYISCANPVRGIIFFAGGWVRECEGLFSAILLCELNNLFKGDPDPQPPLDPRMKL